MGLFDFFKSKKEPIKETTKNSLFTDRLAYIPNYNPIIDQVWDGEKTAGELGAVINTTPDYLKLRLRAYDLNLKTDIVKIITGKFFKWVVGTGLKLQAQPNDKVLKMYGIDEDFTDFNNNVESLFTVWADSKLSDYHKRDSLHLKAADAFKTAFLGGDCLCILRVGDDGPNVQIIDGQQIETPLDEELKEEGNIIINGIELNSKGEHVAFWVVKQNKDSEISHERVKAYNSNGNLVAWMIYGDKARIDHHRGIPYISSILEKISKLDRYIEASVTKAEQTANVVYAFKHNSQSTGENILATSLTSIDDTDTDSEETIFEKNGRTANELKQTTSGIVMNLTPDSDLISLSSPSETQFNEFFRAVFTSLCAAVDIPEEVALQKYEQNYSSSRAAINGWEFIVDIYRTNMLIKKFYEPVYRFFVEYYIVTDVIKSNGFLKLKSKKQKLGLEAFFSARFIGKKMPHIDPLKEVKAVKSMVDAHLISREQGSELLGIGDWRSNISKISEENDIMEEKGIGLTQENNENNDTSQNNE